jgi:DNA-binding CsgD family transcriptional regulator
MVIKYQISQDRKRSGSIAEVAGRKGRGKHDFTERGQKHIRLSPRERELAELVAQGLSDKEMAQTLGISRWTVASHLRRVYSKLGVRTRAEMVAHLLQS